MSKNHNAAYLVELRRLATKYGTRVDGHFVPASREDSSVVYTLTDVVEAFEAGWLNAVANKAVAHKPVAIDWMAALAIVFASGLAAFALFFGVSRTALESTLAVVTFVLVAAGLRLGGTLSR